MQPTQVLAALHTGVVPLQFALVRHCTQTLGFGTVLHFGVGALHCASVWHSSTTIGVGGDPDYPQAWTAQLAAPFVRR